MVYGLSSSSSAAASAKFKSAFKTGLARCPKLQGGAERERERRREEDTGIGSISPTGVYRSYILGELRMDFPYPVFGSAL